MKKAFLLVCVLFVAFAVSAQQDITTFLGIPIDGTKKEMITKLQEKGFEYDAKNDKLTGEFNGKDVDVIVVTNNNKVYRICVFDSNGISETDIRIRYNTLYKQFQDNSKYMCADDNDSYISEPENFEDGIAYQMSVKNKRFQASFYQFPYDKLQYISDYLSKLNLDMEKLGEMTQEEMTSHLMPYIAKALEEAKNRNVWFMIKENYGKYRILMFYENKLNEPNGDDL